VEQELSSTKRKLTEAEQNVQDLTGRKNVLQTLLGDLAASVQTIVQR